ncbi:transposase [Streptomyces sp. NPDC056549]|uniref:transposase n=1 Tax=Streptomyces sp. NPDC056549 TaxID=3345864 RepID=UPI0036771EA5
MKNDPPEFKADAVALYQSPPGATIRQIPADLGINPETLPNRIRSAGASRPRGHRAEQPGFTVEQVGQGRPGPRRARH